ncbi:MAG TPA: hypothetical protein VNA69_04060 [Thermoanaerobaculia bacterium]|nr:hypothetical protein [Thermoanaerobaculia bacterium]
MSPAGCRRYGGQDARATTAQLILAAADYVRATGAKVGRIAKEK